MNKAILDQWVKTNQVRIRQIDKERIKSMLISAEINAGIILSIPLNEQSATVICRELYESIRQLGDAKLWSMGFEPQNHEVSLEIIKSLDIQSKLLLNHLPRFKAIRHDINYRGYRATINQAKDIIEFWNKCGKEIISALKKEI